MTIGHRAIGLPLIQLTYIGSYVPSIMPDRYNAFIYINQSNALNLIKVQEVLL